MATLTTGTMTSLDVQNSQNYLIQLPTSTPVDAYVPGGLAYGDGGWGFDAPFYSTNNSVYLLKLA